MAGRGEPGPVQPVLLPGTPLLQRPLLLPLPLTQLLPVALLLLLAAAPLPLAADWTDCPTACRCKWTSGKKTALCASSGLSAVPAALDGDMQVLDLSGNRIPTLPSAAFSSVNLLNLQRIFLKNAGVHEVHPDAFRDLRILVEVDLSGNEIRSFHTSTFTGNERLRLLTLSRNPLVVLEAYQFPMLPHLRTLELQNCQMERVDDNAFVNLKALESLDLHGNKLTVLSDRALVSLPRLKTLILDGNPWVCDCHLRTFRTWLLSSNLYSLPLSCSEPRVLAGRMWEEVESTDFACKAQVSMSDKNIQQEVGGNVTFRCRIRGDPEPEVTWYFNGKAVGNGSAFQPDTVYTLDQDEGVSKWSNLSLYNVTEAEAGEYGCEARNLRGRDAARASLLLPVVVTATTIRKADGWLLWAGLAGGGAAATAALLAAAACACCLCGGSRRGRKRHRRKGMKGSVSFTDQEKKLLDLSITTTTERHSQGAPSSVGSREALASPASDMEMRPMPLPLPDPPLHITIESHSDHHMGVFPPPPEFSSSLLPPGSFGNIFISVSVSQEPGSGPSPASVNTAPTVGPSAICSPVGLVGPGGRPLKSIDAFGMPSVSTVARLGDKPRFPDLLEFPHRSSGIVKSVSVATGPDAPFRDVVNAFATLPRRHLRAKDLLSQYDNMGPRVTACGSSTLSLPDEDQLEATVSSRGGSQDLPPPPPPPPPQPHCSGLSEYVAL